MYSGGIWTCFRSQPEKAIAVNKISNMPWQQRLRVLIAKSRLTDASPGVAPSPLFSPAGAALPLFRKERKSSSVLKTTTADALSESMVLFSTNSTIT